MLITTLRLYSPPDAQPRSRLVAPRFPNLLSRLSVCPLPSPEFAFHYIHIMIPPRSSVAALVVFVNTRFSLIPLPVSLSRRVVLFPVPWLGQAGSLWNSAVSAAESQVILPLDSRVSGPLARGSRLLSVDCV